MVFIGVNRIALLAKLKTTSLTVGWLLSAADRGRFGGPYLILKASNRSLKKGNFPVLAYVRQLFGANRPLTAIWRTLWRTKNKN